MFRAARWGVVPMPPPGRASVIHVEDLARLLLALLPPSPALSHRIVEPDDGREGGWSHADLAKAIGRAVGREVRVPHVPKWALLAAARLDRLLRGKRAKLTPDRVGYMTHPDWVSRRDKAPPAELWHAEIPTEEGLAATARWYREQGWF
jgi:nucleoside-diphosphate-sugar epimerase